MALSNKFGWLVLTTGNKSEMATGYATLYGDMAGGFAVIKDVPKTLVYRLARYRNAQDAVPVIPPRVIEKAPSAELRPDQRDTDTLPPYEVLDPILQALRGGRPQRGGDRGHGVRRGAGEARGRPWSTATSTSGGRRRPASRSLPAPSAATGGCPSPTATRDSRQRLQFTPA